MKNQNFKVQISGSTKCSGECSHSREGRWYISVRHFANLLRNPIGKLAPYKEFQQLLDLERDLSFYKKKNYYCDM